MRKINRPETTILLFRLSFKIVLFFSLIFLSTTVLKGQVAFFAGGNYSSIRNSVNIENKEAILGYHLGASLQYHPFRNWQNVSIVNEFILTQKGYQQDFGENYRFRFNYLALPVLIDYSLSNRISVHTGAELSFLAATNVKRGLETYNGFDLGIVAGANYRIGKRLSCYARLTYGLLPLLDYYEIDELGNFTNEIHDLKNSCFTVGIKYNLYHEKITFYK